jgi:hypothetical protein
LDKTQTIPEVTPTKEQAKRDREHVNNYFKEAIEKLDSLHVDRHDIKRTLTELQLCESLFSKESVIPKDFGPETEEMYFTLIKSPEVGRALTNLAEFLLETEGLKG